jgi:hypothetical protein
MRTGLELEQALCSQPRLPIGTRNTSQGYHIFISLTFVVVVGRGQYNGPGPNGNGDVPRVAAAVAVAVLWRCYSLSVGIFQSLVDLLFSPDATRQSATNRRVWNLK